MNPYLEVILRSVTVYVFIVVAIRLFGNIGILSKSYNKKRCANTSLIK